MRKLLFFAFLTFLTGCGSDEVYFIDATCIEHISIIDPESGIKPDQTVILKGGKIFKVIPSSELRLSQENEIIDGTGKYMIPGLWDSHVHFAFLEELAPKMFDLFIGYGITSVRDTGGEINFVKSWKDKSLKNPTEAPRVMIAGPLLDGMPNVYDGSDPFHPALSKGLKDVEDVEEYIDYLDSMGVDFLKAYEMLTPEQFNAVTSKAKEKGLMVDGHVPLSMDVVSAVEAGMNSMEHLRNVEMSTTSNWEELLAIRRKMLEQGLSKLGGFLRSSIHNAQRYDAINNTDEEQLNVVMNAIAKYDVKQTPTLALMQGYANFDFKKPAWQESFQFLPGNMEQEWLDGIAALTERNENFTNYANWMMEVTGKMNEKGISFMAGTDCPIFYLTPGRSLHQELAYMVDAGMLPLEVIKSATINPAAYFGLEKELGNVKEGMWADLVILNGNPLEDIKNTEKIEWVIKQGNVYDRKALDDILSR